MNCKRLICLNILALLLVGCKIDDGYQLPIVELGLNQKEFKVSAYAGHIDPTLYSNQECKLSFAQDTPWAKISRTSISGDAQFSVEYDDNEGFARMAKLIIEASPSGRRDTLLLKQEGFIVPKYEFANSTIILDGNAQSGQIGFDTNIDWSEFSCSVSYNDEQDSQWISDISYSDGQLSIQHTVNSSDAVRSARVSVEYTDSWEEKRIIALNVLQKTRDEKLGQELSFEQLRNMAVANQKLTIDDYYIISGFVVSDKDNGNAGNNIKTSIIATDYSYCQKTIYLESLDGKYGLSVLMNTEEDNTFSRYDKISILLNGAQLMLEENPDRYSLSNVSANMIISREAGTKASIPVKRKYISELKDEDIFTYVSLKDCEFPIRKGSFVPINETYTLANNKGHVSKFPRLVRDIQGNSIYTYTNTTCIYRRNGTTLPYGSGTLSGVIVFELYPAYIYGDSEDEDLCGNIGRYQIRHQSYDDIDFDQEETFSTFLAEFRWKNGYAKSGQYYYWQATTGEGRFTHISGDTPATPPSTANYIGWVGNAKGIEPFKNHIGADPNLKNPLGYEIPESAKISCNESGYGKVASKQAVSDGWFSKIWWNDVRDIPYAWQVEFSAEGITKPLSMQFTMVGAVTSATGKTPCHWKAIWSENETDWKEIAEFYVPDGIVNAEPTEWQLPGMKQYDIPLPIEMLGKSKLYLRLCPASKITNTTIFEGSTIPNGNDSGNGMDYFAIRYNK